MLNNIYDIFDSVSEGIERVNKMFGTEMKVRINPLILQSMQENTEEPETGSETATEGTEPEAGVMPIQTAEAVEDKPEQTETEAAEEGTTSAEVSEPETVTEAAVEIIEAAAQIIEMTEGGVDDADTERDSSGAGEIQGDSDD